MNHIAENTSDIIDGLVDLKLQAADKRLFDGRRFPPGDVKAERAEERARNARAVRMMQRPRKLRIEIAR